MYLSIIIPAYNEEKRIEKTILEINDYLARQSYDAEIIVVNDGSQDKTEEVVKSLQSKVNNLKIISNKKNEGKGYVVRQGLSAAKGEYSLFTDADNATPINQLDELLPYIKDHDIVIASRSIKGSRIAVPQPFYRRVLGGFYRILAKLIVGLWGIQDSQCGFKLFTQKATNDILPKCMINGMSFDPEILIIARKLGYRIKEVPVIWIDSADSKVDFSRMQKMGLGLLKIRWNLVLGRYSKP